MKPILAALLLISPASGAWAAVTLIVDQEILAGAPSGGEPSPGVTVLPLETAFAADPISRGRVIAKMRASEQIIAVGFASSKFASEEVESVPLHFEGGLTHARGADLKARGWTGSAPYNASQIMGTARSLGFKRVAAVYTTGYEELLTRVRRAARARGIAVDPFEIGLRRDIPAAARAALGKNDALMVLGDPLLTGGAGASFLIETSLAVRKPLFVPGPALVAHGAFLGTAPDWQAALKRARALAGRRTDLEIRDAPSPGRLVFNRILQRKWKLGGDGPP